jgi:hypothetical protein
MAVVRERDQMPVRTGPGWTEVSCADSALFGVAVPMSAREYRLDPGTTAPEIDVTGEEAMGYVAAGSGVADAGGEELRLQHESVLWLAGGGRLVLTAGPEGLTLLLAESSGGRSQRAEA